MPDGRITLIAVHIPMFAFEVKPRKNDIGFAPALDRANKIANIVLGERNYHSYVTPIEGNDANV
jgi:hypothetical protein